MKITYLVAVDPPIAQSFIVGKDAQIDYRITRGETGEIISKEVRVNGGFTLIDTKNLVLFNGQSHDARFDAYTGGPFSQSQFSIQNWQAGGGQDYSVQVGEMALLKWEQLSCE